MGDEREGGGDERRSPQDQPWFTPLLYVLAGFAVASFQWGPISDGTATWLNWLVGAAGVAVLAYGGSSWLRARPR